MEGQCKDHVNYNTQVRGTGNSPKMGLLFYLRDEHHRRSSGVTKNPCITLFPNLPRHKHEQGSGSLSLISTLGHVFNPPFSNRSLISPAPHHITMYTKPCCNLDPYTLGEPALEEKVCCGFLDLLAKRAEVTVRPSTTVQSIGCPNCFELSAKQKNCISEGPNPSKQQQA